MEKATPGPSCPGCGSPPRGFRLGEVSVREGRFALERCLECGVVSLDPSPSEEVLAAAYDETYYGPGHARFAPWLERIVVRSGARRARLVERLVPPPARVLDVGCGRGEVLAALARRGYEVFGTERDERAAERARRDSGVDVRSGELRDASFPHAHFDFVTIWHVLEHLRDPEGTLAETRRILRPNGTLLVECPNVESFQALVSGPFWFHLDVPRHLHNFGVSSLRRLAERTGFETRRVRTFSLLQGPFGLYQSLLNRFLRPRDALYDRLRRTPASREFPSSALSLSYALAAIGLPLASLLEGIASLLGRGSVCRIEFARK